MACLEHKCTRCEWEDSSNAPVKQCPECGCYEVSSIHDEAHFPETHEETELDDFLTDDFDDET